MEKGAVSTELSLRSGEAVTVWRVSRGGVYSHEAVREVEDCSLCVQVVHDIDVNLDAVEGVPVLMGCRGWQSESFLSVD